MDVEENLEKLGLTKKEAQIYRQLISSGPSPAIKLSKITGINRRSVYDALESLISQGLVNYVIVEKKKVFQATSLDSLSTLIDEKKKLVDSLQKELKELIVKKEAEPKIEVFSGKKSMKGIFERLLESKKTIFIYGGAMPAKDFLKYYYPQWTKKREKAGIKIKGMFVDAPKVREYVKSLPLTASKFVPKEFLSPAFWWLQGNTIYQVFFQENPTVITVQSKEMAKTYYNSFSLLWKKKQSLIKVTT